MASSPGVQKGQHNHSMPGPRRKETASRSRGPARAVGVHFRSGRTSILRKKISAPSDWNWIFPFGQARPVPTLTT